MSMCSDSTIVHVTTGTHCQVREHQILCVASNGSALCHALLSRSSVSSMLETRRRTTLRQLLQLCWTWASLTAWWSTCRSSDGGAIGRAQHIPTRVLCFERSIRWVAIVLQRRIEANRMQHINYCAPIIGTRSAGNIVANALVSGSVCSSTRKLAVIADAAISPVCAALAEARCGHGRQWVIGTYTYPCARVNKGATTLTTKPSDSSCNTCSAQFTLHPANQVHHAADPGNE
jgi:hypothetical protein